MILLLRIWSFSHYRHLKVNTLLTLFGIAFGVAIFVAIQISNQNIRDSFQWTIQQIAGKGGIEIKGGESGFAEEEILKARAVPGVKKAMPVIFQSVSVGSENTKTEIMVLGVDIIEDALVHDQIVLQNGTYSVTDLNLLLEPNSIVITSHLAERLHLKVGSMFTLQTGLTHVETKVVGIILFRNDLPPPYGGNFAMMDIAAAQYQFHKMGVLDRINILLDDGVSPSQIKKVLETVFPGLLISSPEDEKQMVDSLLGSFRMNIKAISEVSILVGLFLIYNTLSLLVVRRKTEIGILRSIGMSGRELFVIILLEAFILGLIGSTLGIGLGLLISRAVLKAISLTITSLYLKVYTQSISMPITIGISGLLMGMGASLLAAAIPAWEASQIFPRDNLIRNEKAQGKHRAKTLLIAGIFLLVVSLILSEVPPYHHLPLLGYLSAFFLLAGISLMIPSTLFLLQKLLRTSFLKERFILLKVAGSVFFQHSSRNAVGIAALMISVSLLISITLMIHSFRKTLEIWFNQTVKADFVIEPKEWLDRGNLPLISPEIAEPLKQMKGVAAVDLFREDHMYYQNEPFILNARSLQVHLDQSQYQFTKGTSSEILRKVIDRGEVLISESFSLQHRLKEGEFLSLNTPSGKILFKVGGIFYDYTTQGGKVVIDRSVYLKYWKDDRVNILALYLTKGAPYQAKSFEIANSLKTLFENKGQIVISNQEIKAKVMEIFDQTFAITRVLEWITIFISLLGVINMLLANLVDQKREVGILRSIGASRFQIGSLTLYESLWMAVVANFLGGLGGTALSLILVYVINKQSFFWTIQFDLSGMIFLRVFLIITGSVFVAAFYPAKTAAGGNIREAVNYE